MEQSTKSAERVPIDPEQCAAQGCTHTPTVYALRINFRHSAKGSRPKVHVAYLELYVCDHHATPEAAQEFYSEATKMLGLQIGGAIGGQLDWENSEVLWVPKMEALVFFSRVDKTIKEHEETQSAARRSSIIDAANENIH